MGSKILFLLMMLSVAFSSCKKDETENPGLGSTLSSTRSSGSDSTLNPGTSPVSGGTSTTSSSPVSGGTTQAGPSIADGTYSGKLILSYPTGTVVKLDSILVTLQSGQFKSILSGYYDCGAGTFAVSSTTVSFSDMVVFPANMSPGQLYPWGISALGGTYSFTVKGDSLLLNQTNAENLNSYYKLKKQ